MNNITPNYLFYNHYFGQMHSVGLKCLEYGLEDKLTKKLKMSGPMDKNKFVYFVDIVSLLDMLKITIN